MASGSRIATTHYCEKPRGGPRLLTNDGDDQLTNRSVGLINERRVAVRRVGRVYHQRYAFGVKQREGDDRECDDRFPAGRRGKRDRIRLISMNEAWSSGGRRGSDGKRKLCAHDSCSSICSNTDMVGTDMVGPCAVARGFAFCPMPRTMTNDDFSRFA